MTAVYLDSSTPTYLATTERASKNPEDSSLSTVHALSDKLDVLNVEYDRVDRYYTGDQPMRHLTAELRAQVGDLARAVVNWPEVIVDSVNRRLNVEGFRLGQGGEADDELWRIFTANQLDEVSPLGHADALVHGIAFLSVWGNDDDPSTPLIAFESAHQVTVDYDPGGLTVRAALKRWQDGDTAYATLYLRDEVRRYAARASSSGVPQTAPRYELVQRLNNPLGAVPVVPMVNRGRLLNGEGRSELKSIAPLADSVNRLLSDLMVTSNFYVTPRRYVTGLAVPSGVDRDRFQAEMKAFWEDAPKSKFLVAGEGADFGQFPEATLDGFVKAINLLTAAIAAIGGLPPDDLGLNTTNPASAEARRAAETTLILRAKEKWRPFGGAYTRAMRLAVAARDGVRVSEVAQEFSRMQVAWADPATPAIAQSMDAAVKGVESGVYDTEAAQAVVGMSPVERAAVKVRAEEAAAASATADLRARLELAREIVARDGLTLNAALALVGYTQAAALNSAEQPSTPQ